MQPVQHHLAAGMHTLGRPFPPRRWQLPAVSLLSCPTLSLLAEPAQGSKTVGPQHCSPQMQGTGRMDLGFWLAEGKPCSVVTYRRECIAMH